MTDIFFSHYIGVPFLVFPSSLLFYQRLIARNPIVGWEMSDGALLHFCTVITSTRTLIAIDSVVTEFARLKSRRFFESPSACNLFDYVTVLLFPLTLHLILPITAREARKKTKTTSNYCIFPPDLFAEMFRGKRRKWRSWDPKLKSFLREHAPRLS